MNRERIAIDMDDVMADASKSILHIYNQQFGTNYKDQDFVEQSFYDVAKDNYQLIRPKLHEKGFFRNLEVKKGAVEVVKELNSKYEVFIVSAAMEFPNSLLEKYEWLHEHFSYISWKQMVLCGDKTIIQADIMIDDHEKKLITFTGKKLLFDAMHNRTLNGYHRVFTWEDVSKILL